VTDGAVKSFEAETGKLVNSFFEHIGWVTGFMPWFVAYIHVIHYILSPYYIQILSVNFFHLKSF